MKEVTHYICEICGTEYSKQVAAEGCERNHKLPGKITAKRYRPISDDKTGYPQTIEVEMSDGKLVTYKRG